MGLIEQADIHEVGCNTPCSPRTHFVGSKAQSHDSDRCSASLAHALAGMACQAVLRTHRHLQCVAACPLCCGKLVGTWCSARVIAPHHPSPRAQEVLRFGLARGRHILVERSCQNALIHTVRRARYFLFMQSQYWEGALLGAFLFSAGSTKSPCSV